MTLVLTPGPFAEIKMTLTDLLIELERENQRLQSLVAELLLKNQQLRSNS